MTPFQAMRLRQQAALAPGDPYWANVASLLHFDGPNLSTTFTDEKAKIWSPNGNVKISTTQSVFGGASGYFDGAGDYITTPGHADFDFGNGNFTVECRFRPDSATVDSAIYTYGDNSMSSGSGAAWSLQHFGASISGRVRGFFYVGTTQYFVDSVSSLPAGVWTALRLERQGTSLAIYVNGTREAVNVAVTTGAVNTGAFNLRMGLYGSVAARWMAGYVDEGRVTKGVARTALASSYVLDTAAFPNY